MEPFLQKTVLDNTLGSLLWSLVVIVVVVILRNYLSRIIASLAFRVFRRRNPRVEEKDFVALVMKPLGVFLSFLVFVAAIDSLRYPSVLNVPIHFLHTDMASVMAGLKMMILTGCFFWVVLRLVDFITLVFSLRTQVTGPSGTQILFFFRDFIKAIVILIAVVVIMKFLVGKDWTAKLVGAMGIGAAALALAAKETIENLIGSFIILIDKPFHIGDAVNVSGVSGVVEKIGLRSTRIRSDAKTYVTLPNKMIVDNIVDDITLMTQRRVLLKLELDSSADSGKVMRLLEDIERLLKQDAQVIDNFTLNLNDISSHAFVIQVIYFTSVTDWQAFTAHKQQIILGIIRAIESAGVKLARNIDSVY